MTRILLNLFYINVAFLLQGLQIQASVTLDADGWTSVTPSADSLIVYVSDSDGNDSNDGLSPQTPRKTIGSGSQLIRDGYPDHLLLKRGDTFRMTGNGLSVWKNGRSQQEPVVVSYYGEEGARPQIRITNSFIAHSGQVRNYQAFIGLDIYKSNSDPQSEDFTNTSASTSMSLAGGGNDILIEDCLLRFSGIVVQSSSGAIYRNVKIRRNIITDNWEHGTSTSDSVRPSGLFMSGLRGDYLLEENFFDHNGWSSTIDGAGANMYNHNVYIQYDNAAGGIMRGNIFARGSSHGMQSRSGGNVERNLFVLNAVALAVGGDSSPEDQNVFETQNRAYQNVVLNGRKMHPTDSSWPRTEAVWGITTAFFEVTVQDNIIANRTESGINKAHDRTNPLFISIDNIVYKWDAELDTYDPQWPRPDDDMGDYYAALGSSNDTTAWLEWLRTRPLRTMPWEMTAYAAINYIRGGFNKTPVAAQYYHTGNVLIPVTDVSITQDQVTIEGNNSQQLTASVSPLMASNPRVTWTSSDESIATVDTQGVITGVSAGSTVITATSDDGGFSDTCQVTVGDLKPTALQIHPQALQLVSGTTFQLATMTEPEGSITSKPIWSSSNPYVATVNSDGLVTTLQSGAAIITAETESLMAQSSITVTRARSYVNRALGANVTTTSADGSTTIGIRLVDGNVNAAASRWSANTFPQSATLDLQAEHLLEVFSLYPQNDRAYQYTIETSTNGVNYQLIVDRSDNTESSPALTDQSEPVSARYIRLTVSGASGYTGTWVSIAELEAYEEVPQVWAGFDTLQGWVFDDAGTAGHLYVAQDPWVFSHILQDWFFLPEYHYDAVGCWIFGNLPDGLKVAAGSSEWYYSEALLTWLMIPSITAGSTEAQWFYQLN